jgi:hypothetical protein
MDNRRAITKVMIYAVISDILQWIQSDGYYNVQLQRGFERKDMNHFFIIVNELEQLRNTENILHHFQVAAFGNPDRYPIDILELVYRNEDEMRRGGIFIRIRGGEIPIFINPNVLTLDDAAINALVDMIVDSNEQLINLIEKSGGIHAAKRPRK